MESPGREKYLRSMNNHFMARVDGRLQFAEQHRLEAAGKLELQQAALQKQRHVMRAVCALSNGQHDESLGGSCPSPEHHVYRQGALQFIFIVIRRRPGRLLLLLTTSLVLPVDPMTHIRVTGKRCTSYLQRFLAKHSLAIVAA